MVTLSPPLRRVIYVLAFEAGAIALSTLLLTRLSAGPAADSLLVSVLVTLIALLWNLVFNTGFEAAEHRFRLRRTLWLRALHALGFEGGLFLFTVPLYMGFYGVGFAEAVAMEAALLVCFLIYTFFFTWGFDRIFPRPSLPART
ncbi:PACE efflux transporter [Rhodobacter capsulatus]|uniref:PACE efflux transporter n=1 Tax=Rhodobacter capsulatus TaxID=1061 RepID=A0A4U1JUF8_RHOCA|nr:PACE efflux transporter [Rhodobacter capsulatus]TKD22697.1 PACE efflux transporter [Rhodobacter capsulatus]